MESIRVADYMDPRPVTFREDESLYEALVALAHSRTGGGPVIDQQHRSCAWPSIWTSAKR